MKTKTTTNRIAQLKAELNSIATLEGNSINSAFSELLSRANDLKEINPTFVPAWEDLFPPAEDQRLLQIPNCKAAVLKVLSTKESKSMRSFQIVDAIRQLRLSYSPSTIFQTISNLKRTYYVDPDGYTLGVGNNNNYYKVKA